MFGRRDAMALVFQYVLKLIAGYRSMSLDGVQACRLCHAKHFRKVPFSEKVNFVDFQQV